MLGLFRSPAFVDPVLGHLQRSRGRWRGLLALGPIRVPLALAGTRGAPDPEALAAAKLLPATWVSNRDAVAAALVSHFAPYGDAIAAGELEPPTRFPANIQPQDVWQFVEVLSASVTRIKDRLMSEVALSAAWDEEHTLGARFAEARFVELNGSILEE